MFFNDKALFYLLIHEIIHNRSAHWNSIAINILTNIIVDSSQENRIEDFSGEIQNIIANKEEPFFRNLLLRGNSELEKLKLIKQIIKSDNLFSIFEEVFL